MAAEEVKKQEDKATEATVQETAKEPEMTKEQQKFVETIENMSVMELSKLVKVMEEKFGVSAAAPAVAIAGGAAVGAAEEEEEKSSFNVELSEVGPNKIQVIKELRVVTSLGLKEAKDLVDSAPKVVKENATKEEAEEVKKKLEAVGAKVALK
jgi:large subunit ribosomal protein L7/L12